VVAARTVVVSTVVVSRSNSSRTSRNSSSRSVLHGRGGSYRCKTTVNQLTTIGQGREQVAVELMTSM